ncbi:MAG: cellobiose phosphorylase [Candidatus Omnitrophota bacterium]
MSAAKPKYYLNADHEFVIENYNLAKPFANFFPGIAGKYGIPMWAFYVNRGQAICSFGIKDKDNSILEFQPANKAWETVFTHGFRTFLKVMTKNSFRMYEPFRPGFVNERYLVSNKMFITSYGLRLEEINRTLGLSISVDYFTVPQDSYAGLVRNVTVANLSRSAKEIELVDGLPQVVPFGVNNFFLKKMSRTIEAWMVVENLKRGVPFYKLSVDPADRPEVVHIEQGNFYLGFHYEKGSPQVITPLVDPESVFGTENDFSYPRAFVDNRKFRPAAVMSLRSKTPSAFIPLSFRLPAGAGKTFHCVAGNMRNLGILNASVGRITASGYLEKKKIENKSTIEELEVNINTKSARKEFDLYVRQTYLDNIMRGGYPTIFVSPQFARKPMKPEYRAAVFYLYSRKHGDLERDYNRFSIQPTYFSQGNGNYRDVNQNRRCDVWFNPNIREENIVTFFNLLQTDGYNPLVVKGDRFVMKDPLVLKDVLLSLMSARDTELLLSFLTQPFSPGELVFFLEAQGVKLNVSNDQFLNILLAHSSKNQEAEHVEGFWTDHWTYNLDLLESYLGVYPEKLKEIVFESRQFSFFDNAEVVNPRNKKYVLHKDSVRQFHSVSLDLEKKDMIMRRATEAHVVRAAYGTGDVYKTTLINKLFCLMVNKMSSLDPFGVGVAMEANKPNWFDALNGLPALFGSSLCETFELKRLLLFMMKAMTAAGVQSVRVDEDILDFFVKLGGLIDQSIAGGSEGDFTYWDASNSLKEAYREKTKSGLSGKELEMSSQEALTILKKAQTKLDLGIAKAFDKKSGTYLSYFINEVTAYEPLEKPYVRATKFRQKPLPLFLEGHMHALRLSEDRLSAQSLYQATRKSPLYDKKLKMYKVTASLMDMPEEIGRCRIFTPGWLENESIWLHMEYKYILELLKRGLYKEYFEEFKNVLIPFQDPQCYGRSILENSSFIVSSAFPEKKLHGNGFVARLSGSTVEFINMWLIMNIGHTPFFLGEDGQLQLRVKPVLPGWLFDKKGFYMFHFLSSVVVTYHNQKKKDTFGKSGVSVKRISFKDESAHPVILNSDTLPAAYAQGVRNRQITALDVYLE